MFRVDFGPAGIRALLAAVIFLSTSFASVFAEGGDPEAGKQKAAACVACHGPTGVSPSAEFPHLAGQVPGYIASQLAMFKSGERVNPVMQGMIASMATEQDMMDVDAFYSSQAPNQGGISEDQKEAASSARMPAGPKSTRNMR